LIGDPIELDSEFNLRSGRIKFLSDMEFPHFSTLRFEGGKRLERARGREGELM
jgi:hypothetical protein